MCLKICKLHDLYLPTYSANNYSMCAEIDRCGHKPGNQRVTGEMVAITNNYQETYFTHFVKNMCTCNMYAKLAILVYIMHMTSTTYSWHGK